MVGHAVSVKIVQTSVLIAVGGPSIFVRTRVDGIVNTVVIPVVRAAVAVRIDRTPRLVQTRIHVVHDAVIVLVLWARSGPLNAHHGEGETDAVSVCAQVAREVAGHHVACDHLNGDRRDVVQRAAVDADATEGLVRPFRRSNRCAQHRRTSKINARGGRATVVEVNVHHKIVNGLPSDGRIGQSHLEVASGLHLKGLHETLSFSEERPHGPGAVPRRLTEARGRPGLSQPCVEEVHRRRVHQPVGVMQDDVRRHIPCTFNERRCQQTLEPWLTPAVVRVAQSSGTRAVVGVCGRQRFCAQGQRCSEHRA